MTNHILASCSLVRGAHSRWQRKVAAVAVGGVAFSTLPIGLSEDRKLMPPGTLEPAATVSTGSTKTYPELRAAISYRIATSPHTGAGQLDRDIQSAQQRVREAPEPLPYLEQLGWLYVAKARRSYDEGFYKLAEQCASALETVDPKSSAALLLRGHILISFHRFAEAEAIARELVKQRTLPFDYGLLGDAVMEQGRLAEAVNAYQCMVDLRPDLQSYSRVAYTRWLKGDLDGAFRWPSLAARAASPARPRVCVVVTYPLRALLFQRRFVADAKAACEAALTYSA